ncbi:MAG: carboxypeptidase regulatory-like domain-containing protein [candidate division KSB1 bacterium]|nr:carboxypeptidase regulatory-like domain-containing protein [candidate division KSB1 bacterium]MDZ7304049.1 carboxypeptidase regulatory-like domain-containing protein [candidate division KSB1 bacterium]MDZ7313240.1 carboxypeptidase regulatory-like domain-containing protein [candidate division KSB1 bacterium]
MRVVRSLFAAVLMLGLVTNVVAQGSVVDNAKLIVTPREVNLAPGQGQKFEAMLFGSNGRSLQIDKLTWAVSPDSLGTITEDGFFMAGRREGEGKIIAKAQAGMGSYVGEARVLIGGLIVVPVTRVVVEPSEAVVPPLGTQQFKATVITPNASPVPPTRVKWQVVPEKLGKISETGLFTAGPNTGTGTVVAFVEYTGVVLRGEARVTVAPLASASIAGQVKDQKTGQPIENAVVWAERILGDFRWTQKAQTDAQGNYKIEKLVPGSYVVRAEARGYLPEFYNNAATFEQATPVPLAENEAKTGIDFSLSPGATISGLVATESDKTPIAGAHVVAILILKPDLKHHTVTDEKGNYALTALPAGTYAIFAEAAGYKGEFYDDARELSKAKPISVKDEDTVGDINLFLATASAISGKVVDAVSNAPVVKALVSIHALITTHAKPHLVVTVLTNERGEYLANVPPGFYVVAAEAAGYQKEFYKEAREYLKATPVQVFQDKHTTGIDFTMDKLPMITGRVTDQVTGKPIAGALVTAFPERPVIDALINEAELRKPLTAKTDENGNYKLEEVRPGKYFMYAEARGYLIEYWQEAASLKEAKPVEVPETGTVENINFTLEQGGSISGFVLSAADSVPLAAVVRLWNKDSNAEIGRVVTDRSGKYLFSGLRTGAYILFASAEGYKGVYYKNSETRAKADTVHVEAPKETADINFYLEKIAPVGGAIAGTVFSEATSNPIPHAFVLAIPLPSVLPVQMPTHFTIADEFGRYKLVGLMPGKYVALACAPRYLCEFYDNAKTFSEAKPILVENGKVVDGIDFSLTPAQRGPYQLAGRVRYRGMNRGAENVVVQATEFGSVIGTAITDNDGNFTIEEVPAGEFNISASGPTGYVEMAGSVSVGNGRSVSNIELNMPETPTAVDESMREVPTKFDLAQNYPNPFNPETSIKYQVPVRTNVSLRIYNALGQEVRILVNGVKEPGIHTANWDGKDNNGRQLSTGIYLFRLEAGDFVMTRKMVLVK